MQSTELAGIFGMTEMEAAAVRILSILDDGTGHGRTSGITDMVGRLEQVGYVELLACGWLERPAVGHCYNGSFHPTAAFFERCKVKKPEWLVCRPKEEKE